MKAIKLQTTILLPDDGPRVPVARIIERINRTTRCELLDLGMFSPGCVITQQDETPEIGIVEGQAHVEGACREDCPLCKIAAFPTAQPKDAA